MELLKQSKKNLFTRLKARRKNNLSNLVEAPKKWVMGIYLILNNSL